MKFMGVRRREGRKEKGRGREITYANALSLSIRNLSISDLNMHLVLEPSPTKGQ